MSDFDYYYHTVDKARGSEVLDALRQSDDKTKAEAIDYLIDRGYLHSEEIYNSAYVNALGDYLGLSDYDPDDWDEYNAPVARGTKHSALDEVHQRLREAGKKRRQQRIAQARRMKQRKFEGHHGHHHAAEMEMTPDIMDYPGLPVVPDSYGTNSALDSGNGVPVWYGSAESENEELERLRRIVTNLPDSICRCCGDSKWTGDGIDFMCVFCEEMKECDFCNEDERDAEDEDEELEYVCDICGDRAAYNFQDSTLRWTIKDDDFVGRPKYSEYSGGNQNDFYCEKHAKQYEDSTFYAENLVTKEAPFAGAGSLFKFGGNDSALGGFTAKELTESSAIHGDFDHAALNYSGHQNIEARAEGDGEVSERVYIRFSWDTPSEYDHLIDEYTITDRVHDDVYEEVRRGNYSGFGSYTYYYDQEDDEGNTEESELEVEYQWG